MATPKSRRAKAGFASSPARLAANRANAQKSTGPKTDEGKAISRRNALKHGLAGSIDGEVMTPEQQEAVDQTAARMRAHVGDVDAFADVWVRRAAVAAVRMDACDRHISATIDQCVRHAVDWFDEDRIAEVETAIDWIAYEPAMHAAKLRSMPEGLNRLIESWDDLARVNARRGEWVWGYRQYQLACNLMGWRAESVQTDRWEALTNARDGNRRGLDPGEADDQTGDDLKEWARAEIDRMIAAERAQLIDALERFDYRKLARDRAEAPRRALFDAAPELAAARKYEFACERTFRHATVELGVSKATPRRRTSATSKPSDQIDKQILAEFDDRMSRLDEHPLAARSRANPSRPTTSSPLGSFQPTLAKAAGSPVTRPADASFIAVSASSRPVPSSPATHHPVPNPAKLAKTPPNPTL